MPNQFLYQVKIYYLYGIILVAASA